MAPPKDTTRYVSLPELPSELQLQIYGYLAEEYTGTLASLAVTCRKTKDAAVEVLYNNIIINGRNLAFGANKDIDLSLVSMALPLMSWEPLTPAEPLFPCRNLQLLDFPRYDNFFEDAFDHAFCSEVTRDASLKGMRRQHLLRPWSSDIIDRSNAIARKTTLLATVTGIRTLCIDIVEPQWHNYFTHLAQVLMACDNYFKSANSSSAGDSSDVFSKMNTTPLCTTRWQQRDPRQRHVPSFIDTLFMKHFAHLTTIEIRTVATILMARNPDVELSHGTAVINGTWPHLPSLRTFKFHGHSISGEMVELFFSSVVPTSIVFNGFHCAERRHPPFTRLLAITREDFRNVITSFEWKNIEPCDRAQSQLAQLLHTQRDSLESVSVVRKRLDQDRDRHLEQFARGCLNFCDFAKLEYLDIDSRFLSRSEDVDITGLSLLAWLNLPSSLHTLSIDAVTEKETLFVQKYLEHLLDGVEAGLYTRLKEVRVGCMGFTGERVLPWKVLGNLPVKYLMNRVRMVGWEYDVGEA